MECVVGFLILCEIGYEVDCLCEKVIYSASCSLNSIQWIVCLPPGTTQTDQLGIFQALAIPGPHKPISLVFSRPWPSRDHTNRSAWYFPGPGHPSVRRCNEYWSWFWPPLGKKRQVLRGSGLRYQHYWHIG